MAKETPTIATRPPALLAVDPVPNPLPAPTIHADGVTAAGMHNGQLFVTLEAMVFTQGTDAVIHGRRQPVAHLRIALAGLPALKEAIEKAEFVVTPVQGQKQ